MLDHILPPRSKEFVDIKKRVQFEVKQELFYQLASTKINSFLNIELFYSALKDPSLESNFDILFIFFKVKVSKNEKRAFESVEGMEISSRL